MPQPEGPTPVSDDREELREGDGTPPGRVPSRRQGDRAAAEYALLGLIAEAPGHAIHGYDLVRAFADGVLGRIVRLESGMLYHYLKKLARDGLVTTRHEAANRPAGPAGARADRGGRAGAA